MEYEVHIIQVENLYKAEVPALPGCQSQGRTEEEALANIRESIRQYLKSLEVSSGSVPRVRVHKVRIEEPPRTSQEPQVSEIDPILQLSGLGREVWEGIDPDEYVRRERESWG
jgi:predicted RNase H-like HicB family nuclease